MSKGIHSHKSWSTNRIVKRPTRENPFREVIQFICLMDGEVFREIELKSIEEKMR